MKRSVILLVTLAILAVAFFSRDDWLPRLLSLLADEQSSRRIQTFAALLAIVTAVAGSLGAYYRWIRPKQTIHSASERRSIAPLEDGRIVPAGFKPSPASSVKDGQPDLSRSPYLGLHAFSRADADLFFGREYEIEQALAAFGDAVHAGDNLSDETVRWLQVEGNSGVGKSSFVNAGLLPRIENHALLSKTGYKNWHIVGPVLPGEEPLRRLAEALQQAFISNPAQRDTLTCEQRLASDEKALAYLINDVTSSHCESDSACLLVIDQFEELFTFSDTTQRRQFDRLVATAVLDADCPLLLINTVRIDFLHQFELLPELSELYNTRCCRYLLKTISAEGLREVIEKPAQPVELDVSEVMPLIRQDAMREPGALPLVENALQYLWDRREDNRLLADIYDREGGIFGLLEAQADRLLSAMDNALPDGRARALELLLALTQVNEQGNHSRRRLSLDEARMVAAGRKRKPEAGQQVINWLSGRPGPARTRAKHDGNIRLLSITSDAGHNQEPGESLQADNKDSAVPGFVDLIHETLVRYRDRDPDSGRRIGYWRTLYQYIEDNPDRSLHRDRLTREAKRWNESVGLSRWRALAGWQAIRQFRWFHPGKHDVEYRFLKASRQKQYLQGTLLAVLVGVPLQGYVWALSHGLPPVYAWTLQTFRMMQLGWLEEPLPVMVEIVLPDGEVKTGERDQDFIDLVNAQPEFRENFGVPSVETTMDQSFAIGAYEVTYTQYDYFVWSSRRAGRPFNYPANPPRESNRGSRAVTGVSWHDANAYLEWLSGKTDDVYRLPTEVEWEYAARAGSDTSFWWGKDVEPKRANCDGCGSQWDNDRVAPVGSFEPNAWGLYDTAGNVWEWTCSVWQEQFDGSEARCANDDIDSVGRAVRGGSWGDETDWVRSSSRGGGNTGDRNFNVGFRVLRAARTR